MVKFKNLFSFSRKQIDAVFKKASKAGSMPGIKLLSASLEKLPSDLFAHKHGKLLIIASRKAGKAHERNVIRRRLKAIYYENKLYENGKVVIALIYPAAIDTSFKTIESFLVGKLK